MQSWDKMQILIFVVFILALVAVAIVSGGLHGVVQWLSRFAKGPRSTQLVTALMGFVVFIDDYANTMIVGASMRPVTDANKVSREKLAFLVDATAAPVAGLALVSTWVGYQLGLIDSVLQDFNIATAAFTALLMALPFRFYCIIMIFFVLANALSGRDFGPMRRAEQRARDEGKLLEDDAQPMASKAFTIAKPEKGARITALNILIPVIALFGVLMLGMWFDGARAAELQDQELSIFSFAGWRAVLTEANSILILTYAGFIGLLAAIVCALLIGRISLAGTLNAVGSGAKSCLLPISILLLAWSINGACTGLETAAFLVELVQLVEGESLIILFPALIFITASLTAFATGTSFGTMAILIPIAVPIAIELDQGGLGLTTIMAFAAVLDGAILGDHCSPISDTTIMSSIASSCDHLHHVRTQIPYSVTVGLLAIFCGYLPAALLGEEFKLMPILGIALAAGLCVGLFFLLGHQRPAPPPSAEPAAGE